MFWIERGATNITTVSVENSINNFISNQYIALPMNETLNKTSSVKLNSRAPTIESM